MTKGEVPPFDTQWILTIKLLNACLEAMFVDVLSAQLAGKWAQ